MRAFLAASVVTCGLLFQPTAAFAWGPNGHRITGQVAQDSLTPDTQSALDDITGGLSLALLATWPDFVRSFPEYDCFKPWHFLTVEDGQSIEAALKVAPELSDACDQASFEALGMPGNAIAAIEFFTAILRGDTEKSDNFAQMLKVNGATPYANSIDLTALSLLVHLVGDVHQPLHVGRGPDRGGNTITVSWFDEYVKLHEVWDEGLIDREALSFTEFADFLVQEFGGQSVPEYGQGPHTWAQESVDHRSAVYDFGGGSEYNVPRLSYGYAAQQNALLKERLYSGGMRLAALLNSILAE